jgi:uncharacterized membrane protein
MSRTRLLRTAFLALIVLYPAIVSFGIRYLPVSFFGVLLALTLIARNTMAQPEEKKLMLPLLALHVAYSLVTALSGSQRLLLLYPAVVNFSLCAVFALSLRQEQPILLRLVRARKIEVSAHGPAYLYRLTAVWAIFFLFSGSVAIATAMVSLQAWALYNGFIAYLLVALLMGGEWLFRLWYKRRKGL